ncbi:MAG: ATP synthase F1 subunit gamma, partial [Solirubrobacterales bacterium]
ARPYAQALAETIDDLLSPELAERFPLLRQPDPPAKGGPRRAAVLLVTSNRGLAGAFNANLIRAAMQRERELVARGLEVDLLAVGKKGINYFKFVRRPVTLARLDIGDRPQAHHAAELAQPLIDRFEAGELASFDIVYAHFKSALSTPPVVDRVLPIEPKGAEPRAHGGAAGQGRSANFIVKPGADELVGALLPLYVRNMVFRALVETAASEHGARRTAMKNATDNAGEMLDLLRRTYNRARQGQITQELAEIVGGAEALQG